VPAGPLVGEKPLIVGVLGTTNGCELVAMPPGVVIVMGPVIAPSGTVAVSCVSEATLKVLALMPLKETAVAPVKPVPKIITLVPIGPLGGEKPLIVGAPETVKLPVLIAVPPAVVTVIGPLVAPVGTLASTSVSEATMNVDALVPLKVTLVALLKFVPKTAIVAPTGPAVGAKPLMVGTGTTVKLVALVAMPPGVVTAIGPVVAPVGTVAVICVSESTLKVMAFVPLKETALAIVKFIPVIVTVPPTGPAIGLKLVILGVGATVKLVELRPVPPGVVTLIGPVVALVGTVAVI
jgi:hypothetical protein